MTTLTIPNDIANGQNANGNFLGANFDAIEAWAATVPDASSPLLVPTGVVLPYSGATAPTGYLLADGAAVSRATYAALFSLFNTTYGSGDGSTTFNLPNLKARFPVGRDATVASHDVLGETGGTRDAVSVAHSHTASSSSNSHDHTHGFTTSSDGAHTHTPLGGGSFNKYDGTGSATGFSGGTVITLANTTSSDGAHTHTGTTGGINQAHIHTITVNSDGVSGTNQNLPPYLTLNYIIKT
jgi:microcystin-dependent protein